MNEKFERDDGKVVAEVLATQPERLLVKATWEGQDVPNILWLSNAYFASKYSKALAKLLSEA